MNLQRQPKELPPMEDLVLDNSGLKPFTFQTIYLRHPDEGEVNLEPSETVPDQALTVQEIMDKYARGLQFDLRSKVPIYEGDDDIPDFKNMDLSEIQTFAEDYRVAQAKVRQARQDQINRETEELIEKSIQERLAKRQLISNNQQGNPSAPSADGGPA